jgi:acyl-CoA thioesterase-1
MRIVMLEPFLLPVPDDRRAWREDLDPKIAAVRRVAAECADVYVPLDRIFTTSCAVTPADHWLPDGVHPSPAGHDLIATIWLKAVSAKAASHPARQNGVIAP